MMDFLKFWWDCLVGAFNIGSGWLGFSELFLVVAVPMLAKVLGKKGGSVGECFKKWSHKLLLFLLTFGFFLIAPYQQCLKAKEENESLAKQIKAAKANPAAVQLYADILGTADSIERELQGGLPAGDLFNGYRPALDALAPRIKLAGKWNKELRQAYSDDVPYMSFLAPWTNIVKLLRKTAAEIKPDP